MSDTTTDVTDNQAQVTGRLVAEWRNEAGEVTHRSEQDNLVTAVGDQYYAGRAVLSTGQPAQVTGFKLGTGTTAVAKTGAGAALAAYLTGSNKANDSGFPTATGGVATFKRTYAAGEATSASAITEVVLVTDSISNDATSTAGNTIARALLASPAPKAALDTLTVTWTHTILGA